MPELLSYLDKRYNGQLQDKPLSSHILVSILEKECPQDKLCEKAQELREIEQNVRNTAAHEIVSVTEDFLMNKVGKNSLQILTLMKQLVHQGITGIKADIWKYYDEMNALIIAELVKNI